MISSSAPAAARPDSIDGLQRLGIADTAHLRQLLATATEHPADAFQVLDIGIDTVPYDLEALTTESRDRVAVRANSPDGALTAAFFVKVLRSWEHSAAFQFVPDEIKPMALAGLPWTIERDTYRSDLASMMPTGLRLPRCVAVIDLDTTHAAIWLEDLGLGPGSAIGTEVVDRARLLGAFAGSSSIRDLTAAIPGIAERTVASYVTGRVHFDVVPTLRSNRLWSHPLVARWFAPLRDEVLATIDRLPQLLAELHELPAGVCHGDACVQNLPRLADGGFAMIDFGFLSLGPLGFDLNQLCLGEAQLGRVPADAVAGLYAEALPAYAEGLATVGATISTADLGRAVAICGWFFSGISAIPAERLGDPVTDELDALFAARSVVQRLLLEALEV